ncbi:hypothetical protein, conserved [Babesia ovata]|uniref:C3H1-type domain-containing protein n=1 Tax=Babesia ovata TaxID=189622 RepID=A0A2H6KKK6_9APIC|nr:uncharacterized protein BOVATA_050190 [Babesia ovata]GBE63526.1 hypothetical protein, conserved [Babesia ovata]
MSFLHGVLHSIKPKLGLHSNEIQSAITSLNTHKHSGKEGFNKAISAVVQGVNKYNEGVKASNKNITSQVEELYKYVNKDGKLITQINALQDPENSPHFESAVFTAEDLVKQCAAKSDHFDRELNKATKDINDLNLDCKTNVTHAQNNVKHETKRLEEASAKELQDLKATEEKIKSTLDGARDCVNKKIRKDVEELVKTFRVKVQKILEQLRKISQQLGNYVDALVKWMDEAARFINDAVKKIEEILLEVNEGNSSMKPYKIKQDIQEIETAILMLLGAGEEAKKQVADKVKEALTAVKEMDDGLKKDLHGVRTEIKGAIENLGRTLDTNVKSDLGVLETGIRSALTQHVKNVLQKIQGEVNDIKNNGKGLDQFVTHVTGTYAKQYANGSFENVVKDWIKEILDVNISVKAAITHYVRMSRIGGATSSGTNIDRNDSIADGQSDGIAQQIKNKIKDIKHGIQIIGADITGDTNKIHNNIKAVYTCVNGFATSLWDKISNVDVNSSSDPFVNGVCEAIENAVLESEQSNYRAYLRPAVVLIVIALHAKATHIAKALERLTGLEDSANDSQIKKVDDAFAKAGELWGQLNNGRNGGNGIVATVVSSSTQDVNLSQYNAEAYVKKEFDEKFKKNGGSTPQHYEIGQHLMSQFHSTYTKLLNGQIASAPSTGGGVSSGDDNVLDAQLPNGSDNTHVKLKDATSFSRYNTHVSQDEEALKALASGNLENIKGALPDKIKGIKEQVENAVKDIEERKKEADGKVDEVRKTLTALYDAVKEVGGNLKSNLTTLTDTNIRKNLDGIKKQLENLKELELKTVIQDVERFMKSLDSSLEPTIQLLGNHVRDEVASAEKTLITHARKQYVNAVKFLLEKFADSVTVELKTLPEPIKKDLTIGHKGFMQIIYEPFMTRVKRIEDIDPKLFTTDSSPLSEAAKKLKGAQSMLFIRMKNVSDIAPDLSKVRPTQKALETLLTNLEKSKHFDDASSKNSESLENELRKLNPLILGETKNPFIVNALKKGFNGLAEELGKTYISTYSEREINWKTVADDEKDKYAKIALTLTPTVYEALTQLKEKLDDTNTGWKLNNIYNHSVPKSSLHALFFRDNGYDSALPVGAEHGELNHKPEYKGSRILTNLMNSKHNLFVTSNQSLTALRSNTDEISVDFVEETGIIHRLRDHLNKYFDVRHLYHIDKPRSPCSIYDMSLWLSGLPHNPVYEKLKQQIKTMFEVPDESNPSNKIVAPIAAYPQSFTHEHIHDALDKVTSHAYMLLTGVVGHGDAETFYACDFPSNSLSLKYPSSGAECLDMLLDILRRMFPVLTFLHTQCSLRDKHGGWRDCYYGKDIKSSKLSCNHHVTDKATCQPMCQANTKPNCQPTSPLMSYLNDSLHGHLPHDVTSVGCKSSCNTCPKSTPGMPCLPPLGFRAFSNSTHKGKDLCGLLAELVGKRGLLTKLHSLLTCLLNRPPQWFPDIFSFYCQLIKRWTRMSPYRNSSLSIQGDICKAIEGTVSCKYEDACELMNNFHNFYESPSHFTHETSSGSDLSYLLGCGQEGCGYIMRPLNVSAYSVFAPKFASSYLSCLLYACSNIFTFLEQLKNAFCDISCYEYGCSPCLNGSCQKGKHGTKACGCRSMVQCMA